MNKRLLSLVLALVMMLSLATMSVSATEIVDSGICGDNLSWSLDKYGVLTISGTGGMYDYWYLSGVEVPYVPWLDYRDDIDTVVIEEGVTSIGDCAFEDCSLLYTLTLPESLTNIGIAAFGGCSNLVGVTIPDSVTFIGDSAFWGCESLVCVTIPDGVTKISWSLFVGCINLRSIVIPNSVTSIDEHAFLSCESLDDIYFCGSESQWDAIYIDSHILHLIRDGAYKVHFIWSPEDLSTELVDFGLCGDNLAWTLDSEGVLTISGTGYMYHYWYTEGMEHPSAPWCDYYGDVYSVVIEEGVISIGDSAFTNCSSIVNLSLPESLTYISVFAFSGCSNLSDIYLPDGAKILEDFLPFSGCGSIWVNSTNTRYFSDSNGVLFDKSKSRLIHVPNTLSGDYIIPNSVTSIGTAAFDECVSLSNVVIPDSVTSIGSGAFSGCVSLSNIIIPDSVTLIESSAFWGCSGLTSITLPDSITSIGDGTFWGCDSLHDIYYCGSESQWKAISFDIEDEIGEDVEIHFNWIPEDLPDEPTNGNQVYTDISFSYRPSVGSADKSYSGLTYKDEWLTGDSYVYNNDLAKMSLGLAVAGFESRSDDPDGNILALYEDLGFDQESFATVGYGKEDNGTVALAIATKNIYDENGQAVPLVALTLRGGSYGNGGWAGNFTVGDSGEYHKGFEEAACFVRDYIAEYLNKMGLDSNSVRIWLTGYSRSAATANLASVFISDAGLVQRENIYTYTFATPSNQRIKNFRGEYDNIFNVVNEIDIVPLIPLLSWNFGKQGSSFYILDPATMASLDDGYVFAEFQVAFTDVSGTEYKSYDKQDLYLTILQSELSSAFPGRGAYTAYLQDGMVKAAGSGWKDLSGFDSLLCGVTTAEEIKELISNGSAVNYTKAAGKILKAIEVRKDRYGSYDPIIKLLASVRDILIGALYEKTGVIDCTYNQELIGMVVDILSERASSAALMQHWPEVYLAWLISTDGEFLWPTSDFKTVRVGCPVDVEIYDASGALVARSYTETHTDSDGNNHAVSLIDESVTLLDAVAVGQSKYFTIPEGEDFKVVITTNDSYVPGDTMDYEVIERSEGEVVRMVKFSEVELDEGKTFTALIQDSTSSAQNHTLNSGTEILQPTQVLDFSGDYDDGNEEHPHSYTDKVIAPTCTEDGYTAHSCECGDSYKDNTVAATGHNWDEGNVTKEPSEDAEGEKTFTCTVCGETKTEKIAKLDHTHKYTDKVTAPTCTKEGYTTHSCDCGDSYIDSTVPATGHKWDGGKVTKEPDEEFEGEKTFTCTVCEETRIEKIDKLPEDKPNDPKPVDNPFKDVAEKDYYFEPVMWAVEKGVTSGLSADTFGPAAGCTRAQVVTFLWRAAGEPEAKNKVNPFKDVAEGQYYYDAVLWAVEEGITTGLSVDSFGPNANCNRGQIVTFLWRAKGEPVPTNSENPFTDVPESQYYYDAVLWAVEKGITTGMSANSFAPNATCTRGQIVTFLYRAYK